MPHSKWDLSPLSRDGTLALCSRSLDHRGSLELPIDLTRYLLYWLLPFSVIN